MKVEISRVNRSREAARASYNRMSRWYDLFTGSEKKFTRIGLNILDVQPGEKVLEVGFGTGKSLVSLARTVGESGKVNGVDIAEGMLLTAQSRLQRSGLAGQVDLCIGDANHLPYAEQAFDAIFMSFTLELFDTPEIPIMLSECRRALSIPGRLCVVALEKQATLAVSIYEWAHRSFPAVVDCRPIFVEPLLEMAGFKIIQSEQKRMWGLPVLAVLGYKERN